MTTETKHLLYWWWQWFVRLLTTSYHLVNRKAYHQYLKNKPEKSKFTHVPFNCSFKEYMELNPEEFH